MFLREDDPLNSRGVLANLGGGWYWLCACDRRLGGDNAVGHCSVWRRRAGYGTEHRFEGDIECGGRSADWKIGVGERRGIRVEQNALFIYMVLQQVVQAKRRVVLGLASVLCELYSAAEKEFGVGKGFAPGGEFLLAHDGF